MHNYPTYIRPIQLMKRLSPDVLNIGQRCDPGAVVAVREPIPGRGRGLWTGHLPAGLALQRGRRQAHRQTPRDHL